MSVDSDSVTERNALLDSDTPHTVRFTAAEAKALGMRALGRIGYSDDEATIIVDQLVDNALCGYAFAGLPRILAIARNKKTQAPRRPIKIVHETPASALIDGGNNVGYLSVYRAACVAIEKAAYCGLAAVGVHDSYYSGRNAYYVEKMAREGLVGIHTVGAEPKVLPPGAAKPAFGTNPICFGFPSTEGPVVFDMGTASIMGGELLMHSLLGTPLPEGIAFDEAGRPTRDAKEALRGGVLPFGGHKGYGLSFCVQALGLLAGSAIPRGRVRDYGFLFLAIKPDILIPGGEFPRLMSEYVREVKATPRQPGVSEIRIPSERAAKERSRRLVEGVVIERAVVDALNAL